MTKKSYKSLYGFDTEHINTAVLSQMPILLDVIHDMHARLMTLSGAEFQFKDDHPELDLDCDGYTDKQLEVQGYIEIIRALESLFTQTVKRPYEPNEPPSLLPYQLTVDYADFWLNECLDPMADEIDLARQALWNKYKDLPVEEALAALKAERTVSNDQ